MALAVFGGIAASFVQHLRSALGHDVAYFLALAKIVSDGRPLYSDVFDQNTPAIVGLDRVAVALGHATGLAVDRAHTILVTGIVLAAFALAWSIQRRLVRGDRVLDAAFGLSATLVLFVFPGWEYGTREHLFFACFLPWVLAVLARLHGVSRTWFESVAVSGLAGFGVFLKPHFAVFPLVAALYELRCSGFSPRALSRETWLLAAVLLAAYSAFLWLAPAFLDTVVPYTVATFWQYRIGVLGALALTLAPLGFASGVLAGAALLDRWLPETRLRPLLPLGFLYLLAGLALVGVQGFGFRYHALPVLWMAQLVGTLVCVRAAAIVWTGPTLAPARARALLVVLALAMALALRHAADEGLDPAPRRVFLEHPFARTLGQIEPSEYAYVFDSSVRPGGWAHVYSDTKWSGHAISMFLLPILADRERDPALYPAADPEALAEVERYLRARILDDFLKRPPALVLVDVDEPKRYFQTRGFDYLEFLRRDAAFDAVWRELDYQPAGFVLDFSRRSYAVYRRRPGSLSPRPAAPRSAS